MDFKLVHCSIAREIEDDDDDDDDGSSHVAAEEAIREKGPSGSWGPVAVGAAVVRRGWVMSKRLAVVGAAVSAAPVVAPPIILFSTLGLALSVPFGLYFAGIVCTEKLMRSLLPLPKEEELVEEWEQDAPEAISGEESAVACQYPVSLLPLGREMANGEKEYTMGNSDREEKLSDGEGEGYGCEDAAIGSSATEEARNNAGEELIDGMPMGESQAAEEEGEESNGVLDGHELQPIVVSMFMSEDLEGNGEKLKSREDSTVQDILEAGVNLVDDEIENSFVNSASEVDALVLDAEGVAERVEDYNLIEELQVADGWQEVEVGSGVVEENAPVRNTNDIAYTCAQDVLVEELCAADTGREEEHIDRGIDVSVLDVPVFDAEAQAEEVDIGDFMIENPVTGVPDEDAASMINAEAVAETGEQIIPMGLLQLEEGRQKEEVSELALGDNAAAAAVGIEVSGGLLFKVENDLKNQRLRVPEEPTNAVEAAEVGFGVNLVSDEIENNFVNSASEMDVLVLDAEGVPETVEDYNLIEELRVADGWKQEEVGIGVLEENAHVLDTNYIAYTCEQDELIEELCAADTGREEELRDMGIDASALDVRMLDAEAQEEDIGIGMVENPVTGVPILDAEAIAETDEQIILMGELQLEEEWTKEEVTELALGDNAAAVEIEVSGGLPFEVANDLKSEWLQVPDELMAAVMVIGENKGGIDEGVNVPKCESANEEVEADRIEVSCRSSDAETDGFLEQLQATQFDVTEPESLDVLFPVEVEVKTSTSHLNLESETTDDQKLPGAIDSDNLNSKDEAATNLLNSSSNERPNAVDHGAVGRNEEVVGDLPHEEGTGSEHKIKAAQETSAASAVEDRSPSGVADDREISLNTEPTVMVHNHQTSMPSGDESWNAEEKMWQQVYALRTIMGCNAPLRSSLAEELKDLYLFTGIEMSSDPSMECSDNSVLQLNVQLQFLKSVIGVE